MEAAVRQGKRRWMDGFPSFERVVHCLFTLIPIRGSSQVEERGQMPYGAWAWKDTDRHGDYTAFRSSEHER